MLVISLFVAAAPARANVTRLVLHTRNCESVSAFAVYDGFSAGSAPFYAVFAADLNGNGQFGEASEPVAYVRVDSTSGEPSTAAARLRFEALPEGSTIAVTAYEVDRRGRLVSAQLEPVSFQCTNRPALDPIPANTGIELPGAAVTARIMVERVTVYAEANGNSAVVGGLGNGARVDVVTRNQRGDWVRIVFPGGGTGWIMWQTQATLLGPSRDLPVE
jgi:hypothetical protein